MLYPVLRDMNNWLDNLLSMSRKMIRLTKLSLQPLAPQRMTSR